MTADGASARDMKIVICRAAVERGLDVVEAVYEIAESAVSAARWSRTTFQPYIASSESSGALQARVMFLACDGTCARADRLSEGEGHIVGFAAFSAILTVGAGEATLENMAVAPAWQRRGVGSRLLEAGLLWCRAQASEGVFLEVRQSNHPAIALYERAGFSLVGNRPGYYREPTEDGLQMQKTLGLWSGPAGNSSC